MPKKAKRWVFVSLSVLLAAVVAVTVVANIQVNRSAEGRCYQSAADIPYHRVGLLLGTSRLTKSGKVNTYFTRRIAACASLYHAGKISKVLVSGDNSHREYNEPEDMRQALVAAGVPDSAIVLDYAGFRTYDSMVRAKRVFGQDRLTVISQHWHNERALYIARRIGIDAVAFDAADTGLPAVRLKLTLREWLARTKMAIDLLFMRNPHFLGQPIAI